MDEDEKAVQLRDTKNIYIPAIVDIPEFKYIPKQDYQNLKNFETKYHKSERKKGLSILNRFFLAALTFSLGDALGVGFSDFHICLSVLLGLGFIIGHIVEFR